MKLGRAVLARRSKRLTARGAAGFLQDFDAVSDRYRSRLLDGPPMPGAGAEARIHVARDVDRWLDADGATLAQRGHLLRPLVDDIIGLGPLDALLADQSVTEIMVNGPADIWVEVEGQLRPVPERFRDADHLQTVIDRMLLGTGRRVDRSSPMVDGRLTDGSRFNIVMPPIALAGPTVTIRRCRAAPLSLADLVDREALSRPMAAFLHASVTGRLNLLVTGAAGAGKTTVLGAIAALTPADQRIVTLEDVAELVIDHPHVLAQQCRPATSEGTGSVTLQDLVRNSLRMRPDRLIVGEVRGVEATDMITAMNTGHNGSMSTVHANGPGEAVQRIEALIGRVWSSVGLRVLREWILSAIDVVVHCERDPEGERRITEVAALTPDSDEVISVQPLFIYRAGRESCFGATGEVPSRCLTRMARHGVRFPPSVFAAAVAA